MKLSRLKSVANETIRDSIMAPKGYLLDPIHHYKPEIEIELDLLTGKFTPELDGDDIENYYTEIYEWFHNVLPKEGIPIDIIDKAILKISPEGKKCYIEAQGRIFESKEDF